MLTIDLSFQRQDWCLEARGTFQENKCYALMGRSGVGKSTLWSMMMGLVGPLKGTLTWQNKNLVNVPTASRPMAFMNQDAFVFPHLSAWDNLALAFGTLHLKISEEKKLRYVSEALLLCKCLHHRGHMLSGGERRRVALARCLLQERPVMILDEPFTGLDMKTRTQVAETLTHYQKSRETLLFYTTHDQEDHILMAPHETILLKEQGPKRVLEAS